jgi:hypothetical protein
MNSNKLLRPVVLILAFAAVAAAQQRPLQTEDPRIIEEGTVVSELGFGYQHHARFPVSGLTGDLYQLLSNGLHFGLGERVEFQMTGTLHNYLSLENNAGSRNDWGDLAISTKIKLVDEGRLRPMIGFRPTVVLPNSNRTKGIGTDGTHFFGSLLFGKKVGAAYLFGNAGIAILDDPMRAQSQQDMIAWGVAASIPAGSRVNVLGEWNGYNNTRPTPPVGGESRGQARLGLQIKAGSHTIDLGATAGTTRWDHKAGFVVGLSKVWKVWTPK